MQVTVFLQPDRVVVNFLDVASATAGPVKSTCQIEVFFCDGEFPAGTVRISWLSVAVSGAIVGLSTGQPKQGVNLLPPIIQMVSSFLTSVSMIIWYIYLSGA